MIEIHDRITERVTRARLALELRRGMRPAVVIVVGMAVGLAAALYIASNVAKEVYTPTERVQFVVRDANGVRGGGRNDVRFKGMVAGSIDEVELRGDRAVITASLYEEFVPLYRNAHVTLRPNSALEDMFLDILDRGTPDAGEVEQDAPLDVRQTDVAVQVENVLQTFSPAVRTHLATTLRNLGGGLEGRGDDLERAFVAAVPVVRVAERLSKQLAQRADLTRSLVHDTGVLTGELARRDAALRRLVRRGAETVDELEGGAGDIDRTLAELPGFLQRLDSSFTAVRGVLPDVDDAVTALKPAAVELPEGLAAVRSVNRSAAPAVRRLQTPVRRLVPLADELVPTAVQLREAVSALRPQTREIDHVTRSVANCGIALQGFFQWTASLVKYDDARGGPGGRGDINLGLDSTGAAQDPNVEVPASCAPGSPIGGKPGTGGDLRP